MLVLHTALPGSSSWIYGEKAKGEKVGRGSKMMAERVKKSGEGKTEEERRLIKESEREKCGRMEGEEGGIKGGDVPSSGHSASGRMYRM